MDLKNNRYTPMDLKRGEKCLVCGKDGTAKDSAQRADLPFENLRKPRANLEEAIRGQAKLDGGTLNVSETSAGTITLDPRSKPPKGVKRGDYLRVLWGGKTGEFHEFILRLT